MEDITLQRLVFTFVSLRSSGLVEKSIKPSSTKNGYQSYGKKFVSSRFPTVMFAGGCCATPIARFSDSVVATN